MGRQSTYTPEIAEQIAKRLRTGEPLTQICRTEGFPCDDTVRDWAQTYPEFGRDYARARDAGFDAIATNTRLTAQGVEGYSSGDVQRDRLIVDTDLKLLTKWAPARYGDRLDATIKAQVVHVVDNVDLTQLTSEQREMLREVAQTLIDRRRAIEGPGEDT